VTDTPIISDIFSKVDTENLRLSDINGFDSLKFVRLIMEIEEKLDRDLEREEIDKLVDTEGLKSLLSDS
jgi:acyl carrier protein